MRDRLSSAWARAGWRVDAMLALVIGGLGTAELLGRSGGHHVVLRVGLGCALAATVSAVAVRRRYPLAAALVLGAVWFIPGVIVGSAWSNTAPEAAVLGIVVLAYTLGAQEPRARGLIGLAALVLGLSTGEFSDPVPPFMFTVPAWIAGEALQARSRLAEQLSARARELDEERQAFAREAVRYERTRIARDLHDVVAHSLSMMVVQAGAGRRQLDSSPAGAARSLEHVGGAARQAELELERLLELLGTGSSNQRGGVGQLIDQLVHQAAASGLPVTCRFAGANHDSLPAALSEAAYRVAQEGLTNALKHAPGAAVQIALEVDAKMALVTVRNGPALRARSDLQAAGGQNGLRGMRERVRVFGGSLQAGPTPDGGWCVTAQLPISLAAESPRAASMGSVRALPGESL